MSETKVSGLTQIAVVSANDLFYISQYNGSSFVSKAINQTNLFNNIISALPPYPNLSLISTTSGNWNSVYTTVNTNSSVNWNYQGTDLKLLSANWQNSFTTVQNNSSLWNAVSTINNYLPLSGGTITGNISSTGVVYTSAININTHIGYTHPNQVVISDFTTGLPILCYLRSGVLTID